MRGVAAGLSLLMLSLPGWAGDGAQRGGQRPTLKLRATPGLALPPADVLLVAELVGGQDSEEFYCTEVEWDFDQGRVSRWQADCEPFAVGSVVERRFTQRESFRQPGQYEVTITLRRADRVVARAVATVEVKGGAGSDNAWSASLR